MQKSYFFTLLFLMALGGISACKAGTPVQSDSRQEEKSMIQKDIQKTEGSAAFMNTAKDVLKAHFFGLPKSKLVILGKAVLGPVAAFASLMIYLNINKMGVYFVSNWDLALVSGAGAFVAGGPVGLGSWIATVVGLFYFQ